MTDTAIWLLILLIFSTSLTAQQSSGTAGLPRCVDPRDPPIPDNMIRPKYPKAALKKGIGETVEIHAVITSDGQIKQLTALPANTEFSKNAINAVLCWRFKPISQNGSTVESTYKIHVRFNPLLREANEDIELESPIPNPSDVSSNTEWPSESSGEQGMAPPKVLYQPEPELSEASQKAGDHGTVQISLVVGSDGLPRDLKVICSSIPESDQNAIDALKQWKFAPATKDGIPVAAATVVQIEFKSYE